MPRGRKRENMQPASAGPIIPGNRPEPPPDLRSDEAREWLEITSRLPVDWFTSENTPLLRELCRHICYARDIAARISALQDQIAANGGDPECASDEFIKVQNLMRAHGYQTARMTNIATKLRLTQQSRYSADRAEDERQRVAGTIPVKPWEDWPGAAGTKQ